MQRKRHTNRYTKTSGETDKGRHRQGERLTREDVQREIYIRAIEDTNRGEIDRGYILQYNMNTKYLICCMWVHNIKPN